MKQIIYWGSLLFCLIKLLSSSDDKTTVLFAIIIKILIFSFFVGIIAKKKISILLPNNIFLMIFFIFMTFGELIWLIRENILFNYPGSPKSTSIEILIIFSFLSISNIIFAFKNFKKERINLLKRFDLNLSGYITISILFLIGVTILTNGFTNIPILTDNIEEGRYKTQNIERSGSGFLLLILGIFIILFEMKRFINQRKIKNLATSLIFFVPFVFYGGRSLMILPFFITFCLLTYHKTIKTMTIIKFIPIILSVFILTSIYSVYRSYGEFIDLKNPKHYEHTMGDSFPEFRTLVNSRHITKEFYGDKFYLNLFSGQLPNSAFEYFGLDKKDYYTNIGHTVTQSTSYAELFDGGIRLTLIGEFLISNYFLRYFSIIIIQIILISSSLKTYKNNLNYKDLAVIIFSYLVVFAFPYGLNFIMLSVQVLLVSLLLFPIIIVQKKQNNFDLINKSIH